MSNGMECWFSPVASFRIAEKKSHGSHGSIFPLDCDVKIFIWKFSSSLRKSVMQKNEEIDAYEVIMLTFLLSKIACAPLECWSSLLCRHSCKLQRVKPIYVYLYIHTVYFFYAFKIWKESRLRSSADEWGDSVFNTRGQVLQRTASIALLTRRFEQSASWLRL